MKMKRYAIIAMLAALLAWPQFSQSNQPHNVTLSFQPSSTPGVNYSVYRGTVAGGPYTSIATVLGTATQVPCPAPQTGQCYSYADITGVGGTTYFYVVTAVDPSGFGESVFSNEVTATFLANPAVPAGVTATRH